MVRLKLKKWLLLSAYRKEISKNQEVVKNLLNSLKLCEAELDFEGLPWYESAEALSSVWELNQITLKLPILSVPKSEDSPPPWDYPERDWYFWAHILASRYGWTMEYIAEIDVDDALALLQEIEVEAQLDKEWEHSLSEIAYPVDPSSKKSKFVPLKRPRWMEGQVALIIKTRKFPVKFLPPGILKMNDETPKSE